MGNNFSQYFNIKSQSLQEILSKGGNYQLDMALLQNIHKTLPTAEIGITEEYVKDLIVFLKNDKGMSPIVAIQYMMSLFNIDLSDASLLYQDYTPNKESTQDRFKPKRNIRQNLHGKTERLRKIFNILNNPAGFTILQLVQENASIDISNLHKISDIDRRSISRYLTQLKEVNIICVKQTRDSKMYSVNEPIYNSVMNIIENFYSLVEKE